MDLGSFLGLLAAFGLILTGNAIEGGSFKDISQLTAGMIVFGGAFGAVMLQFPLSKFLSAIGALREVFFPPQENPGEVIKQIVEFARRARREGILSLEKEIPNIQDPFFAKALTMAVDGLEPKTLYESMETELATLEEQGETKSKVFEAVGGYAPTVGILGAVLGLIHVMKNLADPSKLGEGIAVAFVATIYGVGSANIVFLPIAGKLKMLSRTSCLVREIMLRGVLLIQEGINHSVIEEQLKGFLNEKQKKQYGAGKTEAAA
ncbi:MAG: flagellar motor protein [Candidatus Sumerlaeota bacterium]|nr:flagellar motor protein [Candidatus Sumerlaeota bacterium]